MTMFTGLEIFGNPKDLAFSMKKQRGGETYEVLITRGPRHNFKPLLSGGNIPSKEKALGAIKLVLETAREVGLKALPTLGGNVDECLTEDQQKKILNELETTGQSITYN